MRPRQIEAMLDYLETALADVVKWSDRAEPQRKRGLCIGTSRSAILALREIGLRADALPVQLSAYSPAYVAMMEEAHERQREPTPDEVLAWHEQGAWAVVIGPANLAPLQAGTGGYNGHVIVAVERRWVIDLTLGQASRPEKCVPLPATAWMDCPPLARRKEPAVFAIDEGVQLIYEHLDDRSYLQAHDWTHMLPGDPGVRELAERLRQVANGERPRPLRIPPVAVRA